MTRALLRSAAFVRAAKCSVRRTPQRADALRSTLQLLADDAFHPSLRTHKLQGDLAECWACSAGYDLRVVFQFVRYQGAEAILLLSVGTHDEVY